jgi:hypothetical protein
MIMIIIIMSLNYNHKNPRLHTSSCHAVIPLFMKIALRKYFIFQSTDNLKQIMFILWFSPSMPSRHIRGAEVQPHSFLTSALDRGKRLTSRSGHFTPRKQNQYPLTTKLGGTQSRFGNLKKREKSLAPSGIRTADCPARIIVTIRTMLTSITNFQVRHPRCVV